MQKLIPLIIFGIAFAFVEAAVVVYIRSLPSGGLNFLDGDYQTIINLRAIAFIIPREVSFDIARLRSVEVIREFFTILMLGSVAYMAGQNLKQKLGAFLIAFSIWDLFYYFFLKILIDFPKTIWDIDLYFLIPVPWIGPVITPLFISTCLLIIGLVLFLKSSTLGVEHNKSLL